MRSLQSGGCSTQRVWDYPNKHFATQNSVCIYERPACDVDVSVNYCVRNFKSLQLCEDIVCTHAAGQQLFSARPPLRLSLRIPLLWFQL